MLASEAKETGTRNQKPETGEQDLIISKENGSAGRRTGTTETIISENQAKTELKVDLYRCQVSTDKDQGGW